MIDELFVAALSLVTFLLFRWSFRHLPNEKWQFMATIPRLKQGESLWQGINLTYYGFFSATACTLACTIVIILTTAAGMPVTLTLGIVSLVLTVCMPGSRLMARLVEKKKHTFSIGGAAFLGMIFLPPLLTAIRPLVFSVWHISYSAMVYLSAFCIAYCWGEGIGRLACISFGCCYGKPLSQVPPLLRKFFGQRNFIFHGKTRKISYADSLDGVQVVPIQAVTAVLYCVTALAGLYLFLKGWFTPAFLLTLVVSQLWRFGSEFLRADYRGGGSISAYQFMSLGAVVYGILMAVILSDAAAVAPVRVEAGLGTFRHPLMLVFVQFLWLASFLHTGKSEVTGATIEFHVHHHRT